VRRKRKEEKGKVEEEGVEEGGREGVEVEE